MITPIISLALAAAPMPAGFTPKEWSYEQLLDCYGLFMTSKGLTRESPPSLRAKPDSAARKACVMQIRKRKSFVGSKQFKRDWNGLWAEWWSRD